MKKYILLFVLFLTSLCAAQNIYELTPGTKGNKIILAVSNVSNHQAQII